ncbi:MAG TPA: hypothetical protein PK671_18985, partial [Candidatus Obscuribacter sp.]|nr:hypothetical protein [Candidatus Obscuribacter sp.]
MSTVTSSTNSSLSSLSSPGTAPAQSQALNLKTGTGEPPSPSIPVPVILDEKLLIEIVRASAIVSSEILEQVIDLARVSQRTILDNPFGLHYSEVTASNLVKVDLQGRVVGESDWPI